MKGRDVFIGALLGAFLVILATSHPKGNLPQASSHASARPTSHPASARPTRHSASARPKRHPATARPTPHASVPATAKGTSPRAHSTPSATSGHAGGASSGDWLIAIASVIAIASSAAAVTITVRGTRPAKMTSA